MRLPSIQGLLAFEAVARLRSVNLAADELSITPSAVSHRIRQLETQLAVRFFSGRDFNLSVDGVTYLARVREAITALQQVPGHQNALAARRLRVAVTPTFSRQMLLPRLAVFCHAHPNIELMLQVATPVRNMTVEEADIELRFGTGPFHDRECLPLLADEVSPVCSLDYLRRHGPFNGFATDDAVSRAQLLRTPLESWSTWFKAHDINLPEPAMGNQFSDLGLMHDAAAASLGVALMRLKLGRSWLASGQLVRLSTRSVPSPNAYFLCWRPGALERVECAAFVDWVRRAMDD
ncbi:LysR family transcriptional regulator [Bordetella ansorpii]|uniref:LysR family transcriptional regulator n=1 Tax=Bordetella ansorpii TaxID=288768 RepID=A0A157SE36_9BORD|nr:LysR substrate-binding domain-containing protein [Bordetella ansorpii]SAI68493.1 LysR family transcriptional regulator [Bordetella ansorpii]